MIDLNSSVHPSLRLYPKHLAINSRLSPLANLLRSPSSGGIKTEQALEPQSVEEVSNRMADRGAVLNTGRVRRLLDELLAAGLMTQIPHKGHAGTRYRLGSGPAVDEALDQDHEIVTTQAP